MLTEFERAAKCQFSLVLGDAFGQQARLTKCISHKTGASCHTSSSFFYSLNTPSMISLHHLRTEMVDPKPGVEATKPNSASWKEI